MTEPDPIKQPEVTHPPPGTVKIELCRRLGDDWRLLADYFDIPDDQRRRFEKGWECQGIWARLEALGRLGELAEGLRDIKRADLAELLVARQEESSERFYRDCIARWSDPRYALDKRFVNLTLLLDQGEQAQGPRWQPTGKQFQDLHEVLAQVPDLALVLLGPPGSGKSTLLRHFELDCARTVLDGSSGEDLSKAPLTFFIPLNSYKAQRADEPLPPPKDWLAGRWAALYPDLPALDTLLRERRLTLLLDALNEIPHRVDEYIRRWKDFLRELAQDRPGNRVIFSCRSLDYSASLSAKDLPVPQVRIEPLADPQVQRFLELYCPAYSETLWDNLAGSPQLELLRLPYYLKLLVEQTEAGEIPAGRAALFTGFVRQALKREVAGDNPLFKPDSLLTQRDCQRLIQARSWKTPYELPLRGSLFTKLSHLAFDMQEGQYPAMEAFHRSSIVKFLFHYFQIVMKLKTWPYSITRINKINRLSSELSNLGFQVRIAYDAALKILNDERAEDIVRAGEALGVLEEDLGRDEVLYVHQLLQEYFAARQLAVGPEPQLVKVEWRAERVTPSLQETLASLADSDPLPLLPGTGWEETTVLAAAMAENPDAFVSALQEVNLALAGRCAAQPDVGMSAGLKDQIRQRLIERTKDSKADLRARIAAGLALGELGDPRFERCQGPDGEYLLPPLVEIPGGSYTLGSDEGLYEGESPVHTIELAAFRMGKFPVTNAEWALFMRAGGYEDERWWVTEEDKAWWRGEGTAEGPKRQWRENRQYIQQHFDEIRGWQQAGQITSKQADDWEQIARMGDDEFEALLEEWYPPGRQTQPAYWNDDAFNKPAQPVVGICWYEARAYCAWLSAQTGRPFRLPTEAEWEAAARGHQGRRYAYGNDFDAAHCNTFETHIRRTTPIGVFPGGETPEGLVDITGNMWEWTSSLYKLYPYDAADGREDLVSGDDRRVVRGGSWGNNQVNARAAYRDLYGPVSRDFALGVRVVCSSPILF